MLMTLVQNPILKDGRLSIDAILTSVITLLIFSPIVIISLWVDVVSIPVAIHMFVIPQIGVLAIATIRHYRIILYFDARTYESEKE